MMRRTLSLAMLMGALAAVGCGDGPGANDVAADGATDTTVADAVVTPDLDTAPDVTPDADAAPDVDAEPDADARDGTDGEVDAGPPPRKLVERRLFGTSPIDNRVVNPDFVRDESSWAQADQAFLYDGAFTRRVVAGTPTGQPLAAPTRRPDHGVVSLIGRVNYGGTPFEASVWFGRDALAPSVTCADAFPGGAGAFGPLVPDGEFGFVELLCNETTRVDGAGMTWWRFEALGDGILGPGFIVAQDPVAEPFYVSGPLVTEAGAVPRAPSIVPRGRIRAVTDAERRGALASMTRLQPRDLPMAPRWEALRLPPGTPR